MAKVRPVEHKQVALAFTKQRKRGTVKSNDWYKEYDLLRGYGITLDQYNVLLEVQHGVCAICKKPELDVCNKKGAVRNLAVDHDHVTGRVRGLLCRGCNQGLGNFKESLSALTEAISYLQK